MSQSLHSSHSDTPDGFGEPTKSWLPWGVAGVFLWLLLFAAGVLIPAEESRRKLGWKPQSTTDAAASQLELRLAEIEKVVHANPSEETGTLKGAVPTLQPDPESSAATAPGAAAPKPQEARDLVPVPRLVRDATPEEDRPRILDFLIATFSFTPLNVAFLCVLAAFVGGCSINKSGIRRIQDEIKALEANPPEPPNPEISRLRLRLDYLTEHPGYSAIRGLVVYLIIISGLFIIGAPLTGDDPNQSVSLGQYMKLAGLFSFFGYLSGHDPTVFSSVISLGTKQISSGKTPS